MAHCGLRPQSIHTLGGYKVQRDEEQLLADAKAAQDAGAFAIVLECIPRELAKKITGEVAIPTIGIGAGADCDGQVLVLHDLLGITTGYMPRFAKAFADLKNEVTRAVTEYRDEVRSGAFPSKEHTYE
jgi:3-methyl-2-oxobutanoate hydroxymethyltransferase